MITSSRRLQYSLPLHPLTHHDVLGDRLQHHLFIHVFHQQELGEVRKDELFEARQLLMMAGQT